MKLFENASFPALPLHEFHLFSDEKDASFPDKNSAAGKKLIEQAQKMLKEEIPQLYASQYRRFYEDGNRLEFENGYMQRRKMLSTLLVGELIEQGGRFINKIIDLVWLILEETSWVLPAHNYDKDYSMPPLPAVFDENVTWVDLFSAETAALLSFVYHYLKEPLDQAVPHIINERIKYLVDKRVIKPFLEFNNMGWMGFHGNPPNNWNPWIISNVLCSTALVCENTSVRQRVLDKALTCLDFFIDHYPSDGGCDEGPSYWRLAGGSFFDCLEIIYDFTGGKADYFNHPLIYQMCDYIRKVHLSGTYFAAFADSPAMLPPASLLFGVRIGKRTKNPALSAFISRLQKERSAPVERISVIYRCIKDIYCASLCEEEYTAQTSDILPKLQLAIIRKEKFMLAAKGGHNNESHNHNDIGNFILFANGKPLIIDIGAPTYTKDVFDPSARYSVFPINSFWHNLPVINGCLQKEGLNYRADSFCADKNKIEISYQSAYEPCAKAQKCVREIEVLNTKTILRESVVSEGDDIRFHYYFPQKPHQEQNKLTFSDGTVILCPETAKCLIEDIHTTDIRVRENWNTDTLYRLVITGVKEFELVIQ